MAYIVDVRPTVDKLIERAMRVKAQISRTRNAKRRLALETELATIKRAIKKEEASPTEAFITYR